MSQNIIIRNPVFLKRFDLKIKKGVTLLFPAELKQLNFFREQHSEIYNSGSVNFDKLCIKIPLLETRFS